VLDTDSEVSVFEGNHIFEILQNSASLQEVIRNVNGPMQLYSVPSFSFGTKECKENTLEISKLIYPALLNFYTMYRVGIWILFITSLI